MIEDVAVNIFKLLARVIGYLFIDIILVFLIKTPGYFITKIFVKRDPNPDGLAVIIMGIAFWAAIGFGGYVIYSAIGGVGNA